MNISYLCFMTDTIRNKKQIIELLKQNDQKIKSFGVSKIGLFGSFVKNIQNKNSDIDLIVEFEEGEKSYSKFINLAFFLEELLGRKVDLLTDKSLSPHLGHYILNETEYVPL